MPRKMYIDASRARQALAEWCKRNPKEERTLLDVSVNYQNDICGNLSMTKNIHIEWSQDRRLRPLYFLDKNPDVDRDDDITIVCISRAHTIEIDDEKDILFLTFFEPDHFSHVLKHAVVAVLPAGSCYDRDRAYALDKMGVPIREIIRICTEREA